jgi:hypothetical protein
LLTGLDRGEEAEFFEAPLGVVGVDEVGDSGAELVEGPVGSAVEDLLFERAVEALRDPVGLGLFDEGEALG